MIFIILLAVLSGCSSNHQYPSCFQEKQKLVAGIDHIIGGELDVDNPFKCQELCNEDQRCMGFAWEPEPEIMDCFFLSTVEYQAGGSLVTGPRSCTWCHKEGSSCSLTYENIIDIIASVSEPECQNLCFKTSGCSKYTWTSEGSFPLLRSCFLFKGVCPETSVNEVGFFTGPRECPSNNCGYRISGYQNQTKTTPTNSSVSVSGLVIAGGYPSTVELFIPSQNKSCLLPNLPTSRQGSSLNLMDNNLVLCGGGNQGSDCLILVQGNEWEPLHTTLEPRKYHSSWVSPGGLMLLGGKDSSKIPEMIISDSENQESILFNLAHSIENACTIGFDESVIITGGVSTEALVTQYSFTGESTELPYLNIGRSDHGCAWYQEGADKVLLVAGGYGGFGIGHLSTEMFRLGAEKWDIVGDLPCASWGIRGSTLDNSIFMSGGEEHRSSSRSIIFWNADSLQWTQVGEMLEKRAGHSMIPFNLDSNAVDLYCKSS